MVNTLYFTALILVFLRMLTFFIIVPIFFPKGTPNTLKVLFALLISYLILPGINYTSVSLISSNYILMVYCAQEIIIGLTLGYITNLCFFSIRMGGQLMDTQIGLSMINMFDPMSNTNSTLIEQLLYWCSLMIFFIIDGHHMLITNLINSFNTIGFGKFILTNEPIQLIIKAFTEFFSIGLKIAIPIVLIIILCDITMGLVSRTVPQLNVMILGLPVKILVGLASISLALPLIIKMFVSSFGSTFEVIRGLYKVVPFIIIFASDDKTEEATPRKKSDARKKGQVAKSKEVNLALTLLASTLVLVTLGGFIGNNIKSTMYVFLNNYLLMNVDYNSLRSLTMIVLWRLGIIILPVAFSIMLMGVLANFLQTGFILTKDPLQPKLSKINPLEGFKRIFSMKTVAELIKDLAIIIVVGYEGYSFIKSNYSNVMGMNNLSLSAIPAVYGKLVVSIFFRITIVLLIIALADYLYQRFQFNRDLRMSKQEVKEEYKQEEGDPQIKSKIRQKQREMAMRRMMQQVPDATVVVTNPTHIACALKYEEGKDSAPILIAKGADNIAIKIKEIAKQHDIPIIENKPLARLIYQEVELEGEIPGEMYQAVAEILALVFKLKKRK